MRLMTYQQVAEELGFKSARTARRIWQKNGLLVVFPRPKSPRIPETELEKYQNGLIETEQGKQCHFTSAKILQFGGYHSQTNAAQELDNLLAPPAKQKRKK